MRYRELGKTGLMVSEVGLGCEHLEKKDAKRVAATIDAALEGGVNILDVFMSEPQVRTDIGAALRGRRDKVIIQGHIGSVWKNGQYARSRDPQDYEPCFEDLLRRLDTDYIDIGMLHYIDEDEDFERVFGGSMLAYAQKLKQDGVIRHIGLSTHSPEIGIRAVKSGVIDVILFSINPAFDLRPSSADLDQLFDSSYDNVGAMGVDARREEFYSLCAREGVGITVMKALGAGQLLNPATSPFGKAMTVVQCLKYALDRPGVASVLPGADAPEQMKDCLTFCTASEEEKDYTQILGASKFYSLSGRCMYCNHCLPCPSGIDIAQNGRCLDLAQAALKAGEEIPASVKAQYEALDAHASDCIHCGGCEERCPFAVKVRERMTKTVDIFTY